MAAAARGLRCVLAVLLMELFGCAGRGAAAAAAGPVTQPWRCLCRGSEQITMTRPCLRMILHLLQIFLTLGLTFMGPSRFCLCW